MNEQEFLHKWQQEKPMYGAWGYFVVDTICKNLESSGEDLSVFLKQPVKPRLKEDASLIDKAFFRADKRYNDPYHDIEDKVGCRFVVLLVEHIEKITNIIDSSDLWKAVACRHFSDERKKDPLLFTYQSVHYVVKAVNDTEYNGVIVKADTPCEVQIRTLLQHAYAELTHDAIYKAKTLVEPTVQRTVAKSMALIETTDEFFSTVNTKLTSGPAECCHIQNRLNELYIKYTGLQYTPAQKSSMVILDTFQDLVNDDLIDKLEKFLRKSDFIAELVKSGRKEEKSYYSQSIVLFIYWLIKKRKKALLNNWPLDRKIVEDLANDIGASLDI